MNLELKRDSGESPIHGTFGKLFADGVYACETLEDPVREIEGAPVTNWKIKGDTAIPRGKYRLILNNSQRFRRELPLLLSVPGWDGIRIHPGNTAEDTEGCILVGTKRSNVGVLHSRDAFNDLFQDIQEALAAGEQVWIEVA